MNLNNTLGFNQSSQDFGLFTNVRDALPHQRSYHFTQHTPFNLALGEPCNKSLFMYHENERCSLLTDEYELRPETPTGHAK